MKIFIYVFNIIIRLLNNTGLISIKNTTRQGVVTELSKNSCPIFIIYYSLFASGQDSRGIPYYLFSLPLAWRPAPAQEIGNTLSVFFFIFSWCHGSVQSIRAATGWFFLTQKAPKNSRCLIFFSFQVPIISYFSVAYNDLI